MWIQTVLLTSMTLGAPSRGESLRQTPVVRAVERVSPAVVGVQTHVVVASQRRVFDWFFRDFSRPSAPRREQASQGSGVIIDSSGYIVTNYHVIAGGHEVEVELVDGELLPAKVVGSAPDHDLAVLKVTTKRALPFVQMGTSKNLLIGETVIAIGNPYGLSHSVTTGVVSAVHRSLRTEERTYADFIQTDASINPGNSGGPLLTLDGELVGVNTAIYGKAQGIGFAIPIDKARRIVVDLLRHGEVRPTHFGFELQPLTREAAQRLRVNPPRGAVVVQIDERGPAHGKLSNDDVITKVGGIRTDTKEEVQVQLSDFTVGARVGMEVVRAGKKTHVVVKPIELSPAVALGLAWQKLGIKVHGLTAAEADRARLPQGSIIIAEVARGSPAARYGLRRGDWVRAINSEKVAGTAAFGKALARSTWRGAVILLVQRGGVWQQFSFNL